MKISIVIPAYNEEKNLPKIIESLRNQTGKNFEIIVVDNNSTDGTFEIAKKLADKVYKCKEQGISPARNCGAKKSKEKIVAFLDADSTPSKNWIKIIQDSFKDKSLSAVSGIGFYEHPEFIKRMTLNTYSLICFCIIYLLNKSGKWMVTGNNMAIKRNLFLKVGGFDNLIIEDYYFGLKLRKLKNFKCIATCKMKVNYSSRRIQKEGMFKMMFMWFVAGLRKTSHKKYKLHDKL